MSSQPASFAEYVTSGEVNPVDGDPQREYVSGGPWDIAPAVRHLQDIADGVCGEITIEKLNQMSLDSQVSACLDFIVESAFGEGYQLLPPADENDPEFELSLEIAERALRAVERPDWCLTDLLKQMLRSALIEGAKIAEKTYELIEDPSSADDGFYLFKRIAVKPRTSVNFVVDPFWNVIAIFAKSLVTDAEGRQTRAWKYWNPRMFCWLSLRKEDEDPRGRSSIRAAYPWWYLKTQVPRQFHRWIVQCALPIFLGFTAPAEGQTTTKQASGEKVPATKQEVMLKALTQLQSMMAAVFPYGALIEVVKMEGEGKQFGGATDVTDKQIVKAILWQELATRDAEHQTKGSTGEQMTIVDLLIASVREVSASMCKKQIFFDWVELNYGRAAAVRHTPDITFGDTERRNFEMTVNAISNGWKQGLLKLADPKALFEIMGIPLADNWEKLYRKIIDSMLNPPTPPAPGGTSAPGSGGGGNNAASDGAPAGNAEGAASAEAPAGELEDVSRVRPLAGSLGRLFRPHARVVTRRVR